MRRENAPQTSWAPCNANAGLAEPSTFHPLSDKAAAALVTPEPETRRYNTMSYTIAGKTYPATNYFVPAWTAIIAFRHTKDSNGQTMLQFNPYVQYVDGRDGISRPSTDDLIQWGAHKWGIPEDWLRAEYSLESYWSSFQLGDEIAVSSTVYDEYPLLSRVPNSLDVYRSLGITQIMWSPDGSVGAGTEPLRWESTAFNIDFQAAAIRYFYDNPEGARSTWGDASYQPCQQWNSIGAWYAPYPWGNSGQAQYVAKVQISLSQRVWQSSSFLNWVPTSFPNGVQFP